MTDSFASEAPLGPRISDRSARCADGEEERRAERYWRRRDRFGDLSSDEPPPPEDRDRWRERAIS